MLVHILLVLCPLQDVRALHYEKQLMAMGGNFPPLVAKMVWHNFIDVDDYVKLVTKESEAIQVVKDLTVLCSKGGFQLTQWVRNS